jgi:hypothetical protein
MFRNREDAARRLAEKLKGRELYDPLVLAIPRGGVVTGAVIARAGHTQALRSPATQPLAPRLYGGRLQVAAGGALATADSDG